MLEIYHGQLSLAIPGDQAERSASPAAAKTRRCGTVG
jgi:hypothetical protein